MPPWSHVRREQTEISPQPESLPLPDKGIIRPYARSMGITAKRILEGLECSTIPDKAVMQTKFGFDGSGSHAIYRQLDNVLLKFQTMVSRYVIILISYLIEGDTLQR